MGHYMRLKPGRQAITELEQLTCYMRVTSTKEVKAKMENDAAVGHAPDPDRCH